MRYFYLAIIICFTISGNLFAQELMDAWDAVDAGREALLEAPAPPDGYAQSEYAQSNSAQSNEQLLSGWEAVDRGRAMERDHWQRTGYVPPTAANGWYQNPWDVVIWNAPPVPYYYPAWQPQRVTVARLQLPPSYVYGGDTEAYNRQVLAQIAARQAAERAQAEQAQIERAQGATSVQDGDNSDNGLTQQPPVSEQVAAQHVAAVVVMPSQSQSPQPETATLKIRTEGTETEASFSTQGQGEMLQKLSAQHFTAEEQRKKEQEARDKITLTLVISGVFSIPLLLIIVRSANKIIEGIKEIKQLDIERYREANQLLLNDDSQRAEP